MPTPVLPDNMRPFDDMRTARKWLRDGTLDALSRKFPIEDDEYRLELADLSVDGPEEFGLARQKKALMRDDQLRIPIKGTWRLVHKPTSEVLDSKQTTVMHLPYVSDRGTIINGGNEYSSISQMRLRPGVYARRKKSGEVEAMYNIKPGTGKTFRTYLEPSTGVLKAHIGQANLPLYPLMKVIGATDEEMQQAWGQDIWSINRAANAKGVMQKYYERLVRNRLPEASEQDQADAVRAAMEAAVMDPDVNARTLGLEKADKLTPALMLRSSAKLLAINRGDETEDDRDNPQFSDVYSIEDHIAERVEKDAGQLARNLLWKARRDKSLKRVHPGALTPYVQSYLLGSRLAMPLEETNPLSLLEQLNRVTKLGEGGISSADSVTDEARNVNPGQLGFLDPIMGPECYDGETEVMTARGWTRWPDVNPGDKFLCLIDGEHDYCDPVRLVSSKYNGFMVSVMGAGIDLRITPGHRCYIRPVGIAGFDFVQAYALECEDTAPCEWLCSDDEGCVDAPVTLTRLNYGSEKYTGTVYCATVPGSLLLVRRNGSRPVWSGNSEAIGVDTRVAYKTFKGRDKKLYGEFLDKAGKPVFMTPGDVAGKTIAFPGQMATPGDMAVASVNGEIKEVPKDSVDISVPSFAHMMSANVNLNPMPTALQAARQFYGAKFWGQYMPQTHGEAPLVASKMPDSDLSTGQYYGRRIGALTTNEPGTVTRVTGDKVVVTTESGEKKEYDLVKDFAFNRMTGVSYRSAVEKGQKLAVGDVVARSNFIDDTDEIRLGKNLNVAVIPYRGHGIEDGVVISESAARKMATDRLFGFDKEARNGVKLGRNKYASLFPDRFSQTQLANLDDDGIVKPGTILKKGDPIVLATGPKLLTAEDVQLGKLHKALRNAHKDMAETWEHDYEGRVTDAVRTRSGAKVNVAASVPMQVADKTSSRQGLKGVIACYDDKTEVFTDHGWVPWTKLTMEYRLACLIEGRACFRYPEKLVAYDYEGEMIHAEHEQLDYCVTPEHRMWCRIEPYRGCEAEYRVRTADDVYGKSVAHLCAAEYDWDPSLGPEFDLRGYVDYDPDRERKKSEVLFDIVDVGAFLGWYIAEGNVASYEGHGTGRGGNHVTSYKIQLGQSKSANPGKCDEIAALLTRMGFGWLYHGSQFTFSSKPWHMLLSPMGLCKQKRIPGWAWGMPRPALEAMFRALIDGDGNRSRRRTVRDSLSYTSTSYGLCEDVERLATLLGYNAKISRHAPNGYATQWFVACKASCELGQTSARFVREPYRGTVYCAQVPGGLVYVRRGKRPMWCGNSIIPDDKMPRNAATDEPYDVLLNPMTILSRVAAAALIEMQLGKVAAKTGKRFVLPQEAPEEGWNAWALQQLKDAKVDEKDAVFDPGLGRALRKPVATGKLYMSAFHHLAEKKLSARGGFEGGFTQDELPAKGGGDAAQAKRMSGMDQLQMLSHGAKDVMRDALAIRGAKNENYFKALRLGVPLPEPETPFIYDKFMSLLKAGGMNIEQKGHILSLLPMTDNDVDSLSRGPIRSAAMLDRNMMPIPGGLFDPGRTGGAAGKNWSHIELSEPLPNPVFEEPIRRLLGLRVKDYGDVIAGRQELNGATGGAAIRDALASIDIDGEIDRQRALAKSQRGANRDNAIKALGYLASARKTGVNPASWVMTKVPVLPPVFRPVSKAGDTTITADLNDLYRDMIEVNNAIPALRKDLPDSAIADEREALYSSLKAVIGLGDSITPEGRSMRLKGAIRQVVGDNPKRGLMQSKVLSKPVGMVGRGVISPDPTLDMDQVGIPEDGAWKVYKDLVIRRLVKSNYPVHKALEMIERREPQAKSALLDEMAARPVIMDRAPTWHKFNLMAFRPVLTEGHSIKMPPLPLKGFTADFDGNCLDFDTEIYLAISKSALYSTPEGREWFSTFQQENTAMATGNETGTIRVNDRTEHVIKIGKFPRVRQPVKDRNGADVYAVPPGVSVLSYDHVSGRSCWLPVDRFTEEHGCPCVEVTAGRSRKAVISDNESLAVFDPATGNLVKRAPREALGCAVPVVWKDATYGDEFDSDIGWWYGVLVGDGWVRDNMVGYSKLDDGCRARFEKLARSKIHENFTCHEYRDQAGENKPKYGKSVKIHLNGKDLPSRVFNIYDGGKGALYKKLPDELLSRGSEQCLLGLFMGLLDGDSSVTWNTTLARPRLALRFNTSSPALVRTYGTLFRKLGIRYSVTTTPAKGTSAESYVVCPSVIDTYVLLKSTDLRPVRANVVEVLDAFMAVGPGADDKDLIPVERAFAEDVATIALRMQKMSLYTILRRAATKTLITRPVVNQALEFARANVPDAAHIETLAARAARKDVFWEAITDVTDAGKRDVYDFEVPGTKVFALHNGLVVYDTMNFHVPVDDKAVKQAYEKMLPSKNLFSLTDLESPRHVPQQELSLGLYLMTRPPKKGVHAKVFRTAAEAKLAYRRGEIDANDPVEILEA